MKYMYTCNAMMSWAELSAKTETAAKREAALACKAYGLTAGVIRVGVSRPACEFKTVARKGLHFGKGWQPVI